MNKILCFGDTHLGLRNFSIQKENGLYSAEEDCMNALEIIYNRCSQSDVSSIIFLGDITHTSTPSSLVTSFLVEYFLKMNKLEKPFYIITGNHCSSIHSNSILFSNKLQSKNIILIDKENDISVNFGKYFIQFAPYIYNKSFKEREDVNNNSILKKIKNVKDNTIIVAHVMEASCQFGSEAKMIAKNVDCIDINGFDDKNIVFILGHIHRHQIYTNNKKNIKVIYPGSLVFCDAGDLGQQKGYILLDENLNVTFEEIKGIRRFNKYTIPEFEDPIEFLSKLRISKNQVVFIEHNYSKININEIYKFFKAKDCIVGSIKKINQPMKIASSTIINKTEISNPYSIMTSYIESKAKENNFTPTVKDNLLSMCKNDIDSYVKVITKEA